MTLNVLSKRWKRLRNVKHLHVARIHNQFWVMIKQSQLTHICGSEIIKAAGPRLTILSAWSSQLRTLKLFDWWDETATTMAAAIAMLLSRSKTSHRRPHTACITTVVLQYVNKAASPRRRVMDDVYTVVRQSPACSTRSWSGSRVRSHSCLSGMRPCVPDCMCQGSTNLYRFHHVQTSWEVVERWRSVENAGATTTTTNDVIREERWLSLLRTRDVTWRVATDARLIVPR